MAVWKSILSERLLSTMLRMDALRAIKYRLKGSAVFGMIRLTCSYLSCDAVREHGAESNLSHMNNSVSEDFYTNDSIPEDCAEYAQESGF